MPEHTLICWEGQNWLRQGIACAPAECHPLSKGSSVHPDDDVDSKIARTIELFAFCDDCKKNPDLAPFVQEVVSPDILKVESCVIPPQELGSYSEGDASDVYSLIEMWSSCTQQCKLAIQNFEEELGKHPEAVQTAISLTLRNIMGTQLLTPDESIHDRVLTKSIQEAEFLVTVLGDYMKTQVPRSMSSELADLIRNKYHHTEARRKIFCKLVDHIKCYNFDPIGYKIAIENIALQLARSLGRDYELDAREDAYLKTRDWVDGCESTPAGCCYTPRSSFTAGKKRKALHDAPKPSRKTESSNWPLRVDTDKARNPPPDTEDIPDRHLDIEIDHIKLPVTRTTLRPLDTGPGPWGIKDVLSEKRAATLRARLERANKVPQPSTEEGRTVAANATFMGKTLSDSGDDGDGEINEKESGAVGTIEEEAKDKESSVVKEIKEEIEEKESSAVKGTEEEAKQKESGEVKNIEEEVKEKGSGTVENTEEDVKEKESDAVNDVEEEVDDQQDSVRPSHEQLPPRKGSREYNLRKRPRLS